MAKSKNKSKTSNTGNNSPTHVVPAEYLDDPVAAPAWAVKLVWVLRLAVIATGAYYLWIGSWTDGILTLLAAAMIITPAFFTRGWIRDFPIEIDLLLFIIVFVQFTLGSGEHSFYTAIPYSDKIVHFFFPMIVGLIAFMLVYTMHHFGKLEASIPAIMLLIVLISVGVAGAWEMIEYGSDRWFYPDIIPHHFQGNAEQGALDDTMTDIYMGFFGGIGAAFMGRWLIRRAESKQRPRLYTFLDEMGEIFSKG